MAFTGKAQGSADLRQRIISVQKHGLGSFQPLFLHIRKWTHSRLFLEEMRKPSAAQTGGIRQLFQGNFLLDMAVDVVNGAADGLGVVR